MLDVGWTEMLLIGVVALIVVKPEDLPHLFRTLGRVTARARALAREFSAAMEDAAKGAGLDEAAKSLDEMRRLTSRRSRGLDALERAADRFEAWDARSSSSDRPPPAAPEAPALPDQVPHDPQPAKSSQETLSATVSPKRHRHPVRRRDGNKP